MFRYCRRPPDDDPIGDGDAVKPGRRESASSESSVDLADVEFEFTPEERRAIRKKRKEQRREVQRNQLLLKRRREAELAQAKKDRFFDKSRIIPSEIYFGDIVVPLHVLHSYGQKKEERQAKPSSRPSTSSPGGRPVTTPPRPSPGLLSSSRIEQLKRYLKAAGIKQSMHKSTFKSCITEAQLINAIIKILRMHGLKGDPTMAKCRELKRGREESVADQEELDPSVIINPNARTLRSGLTIVEKEEEEVVQPPDSPPVTVGVAPPIAPPDEPVPQPSDVKTEQQGQEPDL